MGYINTTANSAADASSRNGTRIYLILLCHFMTHNQKLRCSPETFRLSFNGIQGVPQKLSFWHTHPFDFNYRFPKSGYDLTLGKLWNHYLTSRKPRGIPQTRLLNLLLEGKMSKKVGSRTGWLLQLSSNFFGTPCPTVCLFLVWKKSTLIIFFSHKSNSTITNVYPFVCPSAKSLNILKSSFFIIHHSSFILHPSSSFITLHHSSFILSSFRDF